MTAVADRLRTLSGEPELSERRSLLVSLADAVDHGQGAEEWSTIDVSTALGGPIEMPAEPERLPLTALEIARVVLIFLPIMSTWYGLDQATRRYSQVMSALTPEQQAAAPSFFQQWLTGFDDKLWFTFQKMTVVTLVVVFAVIAVSVVIEFLQSQAVLPPQNRRRDLTEQLAAALAGAALELAGRRLSSPARFREEMTKAATEMNLNLGVTRQVSAGAAAATASLEAALRANHAAVASLTQVSTGFGSSTGQLVSAIARIGADNVQRVDDLTLSVDAAAGRLEVALADWEARLSTLLSTTRAADHQQMEGLRDSFLAAVQTVADEVGRVADATRTGFQGVVRPVTQAVTDVADRLPQAVQPLEEALARLEHVMTEVRNQLAVRVVLHPDDKAEKNGIEVIP